MLVKEKTMFVWILLPCLLFVGVILYTLARRFIIDGTSEFPWLLITAAITVAVIIFFVYVFVTEAPPEMRLSATAMGAAVVTFWLKTPFRDMRV
jgi:cytochrome bd-type quinol oxidase subunit 2